jgi:hypothetical protein
VTHFYFTYRDREYYWNNGTVAVLVAQSETSVGWLRCKHWRWLHGETMASKYGQFLYDHADLNGSYRHNWEPA